MNIEEIEIKNMVAIDWEIVAEIYKQGIDTGNATFQHEIPTWDEWNDGHLKKCRLIATIKNQIVGWAALSPVSERCVYAGVAEVSVYVSNKHKGKKVGSKLLEILIQESEKEQIWTLQAGIFPENIASVSIHSKLGFRAVGFRERIGRLNHVWRDTILFEKRSSIEGMD